MEIVGSGRIWAVSKHVKMAQFDEFPGFESHMPFLLQD